MIGFAAERLMELKVGALAGAGYGEKSADRRSATPTAIATGRRGTAPWSCASRSCASRSCASRSCARAATSPAFSSRDGWCLSAHGIDADRSGVPKLKALHGSTLTLADGGPSRSRMSFPALLPQSAALDGYSRDVVGAALVDQKRIAVQRGAHVAQDARMHRP